MPYTSYEDYSKQTGGGKSFKNYQDAVGPNSQNADIQEVDKNSLEGFKRRYTGKSVREIKADNSGFSTGPGMDENMIYGKQGVFYDPNDAAINGAWNSNWAGQAPASLTGLQTAARPPVQQPAPTGNPTALPQIEGPGMMQSQGGSSATALSAAATTAIGGGATPAAQAAQAATPPSVAPPPATPAPPSAPAPVQPSQKFRSKSSLAGLKRAGRRAY